MKRLLTTLVEWLSPARRSEQDQEPIRAELYSVERLEELAVQLAAEHETFIRRGGGRFLLPRLKENRQKLVSAYRALAATASHDLLMSPAAEWLIDNFHIVDDQLREIGEDLPNGYYDELPKLATGEFAGYPRVYALAVEFIAHTDSHFDLDALQRFTLAYERGGAVVTTGELWAAAITMRLALIENLRRLANLMVGAHEERKAANALADELLEAGDEPLEKRATPLADKLRQRGVHRQAFLVQLIHRLREQTTTSGGEFEWLMEYLAKRGLTVGEIVELEHRRQAATQVSVGNIITSMRLLSTFDWLDFFESVSPVDRLLGQDPAGFYSRMDSATRDRYRHVIERIGKRARVPEREIAIGALALATQAIQADPEDEIRGHVGYYLVDDGLNVLEQSVAYRSPLGERGRRFALCNATAFYLSALALLIAIVLGPLLLYARESGITRATLVVFVALFLVPVSELALSALHLCITLLFRPRTLPKIDTLSGIPEDGGTMVVVPTMFSSEASIGRLIERMEVHYLANRDEHIYFALLCDFTDASAETMPEDEQMLDVALAGIMELNTRHDGGLYPRFHLFHRRRKWSSSEEKWIGWERKRGKLEEFNRLLRGGCDTSYESHNAAAALLSGIKYVITLDADTQLPRDAARRLIGTILHPLNKPRFEDKAGRVVRGYGVLQPRISITPLSATRSPFARLFSGNTGIDPYTTAVSDVYQDLFAEGSYTGKGLYEVDAFAAALADCVPENAMLSHDLFEGSFARTALVTDIEVFDDYPSRYDTYAKRQHRWARGDWQLLHWLWPLAKDGRDRKFSSRLTLNARWKMLDNLRRTLVGPALLLSFAAAWALLPGSPVWWTLFLLVVFVFPSYANIAAGLVRYPRWITLRGHLQGARRDGLAAAEQVLLSITFLAHQAYLMVDAILRTLYRLLVSRKHLLEWETAAQMERQRAASLGSVVRFMASALVISPAIAALVLWRRPEALLSAAPFLVLWLVSPIVAYGLSRRLPAHLPELSEGDRRTLRLIARRTWRFFETFVGEEDNWLPPDNFQEDPAPVIAHRTSPTNMGLLLLSTVAAHDFGYIGTHELIERLELSLAAMEKLERFQGHFFNWYDTRTLAPLVPQYVSTVDSGNLAGHLLALKGACLALSARPLFDRRVTRGLADTISLLGKEADRVNPGQPEATINAMRRLRAEVLACDALIALPVPDKVGPWLELFESLAARAAGIEEITGALAHDSGAENYVELRFWTSALFHEIREHRRDFDAMVRWVPAVPTTPSSAIASSPEMVSGWNRVIEALNHLPLIAQFPAAGDHARDELAALRVQLESSTQSTDVRTARIEIDQLLRSLAERSRAAKNLQSRVSLCAARSETLMQSMDFRFLFEEERKVLTIGYNVRDGRRDNSYYDLLASEARLASFMAIAKGDVPQEHWFRLGRQMTSAGRGRALVSWTATMFEYLMPLLVLRNYQDTLLDETYRAVVATQIAYGSQHGVAWGVSESAYNARDLQLTYQYGPFGVPGLGLKRGLSQNLVIAPYATLLAGELAPLETMENLRRLTREGALARYGFYEAIDYTPERLPKNRKRAIIGAFMAHHQGMSLVALDNLLHRGIMQQRFHSDPLAQATAMLLQERIPRGVRLARPRAEEIHASRKLTTPASRSFDTANLPAPQVQLLSNGAYSVMVTTAGSGYSTYNKLATTRWREDATRDDWGSFCYVRDVESGTVWSTGFQPTLRNPQSYEVVFSEDKVEIRRSDNEILVHTEIIVSSEEDAEMRRVSLTNDSKRVRHIELTSYAEVVLASKASDDAHPAFSNLFIETELDAPHQAILAHRRPRTEQDEAIWAVHSVVGVGEQIGPLEFETDRARFLGRGRTVAAPEAVTGGRPLSNTVGATLDPAFSLRKRLRLQPGETAHVTFATAVARSREEALTLAGKFQEAGTFDRAATMAWTRAQIHLQHLNVGSREAQLFQQLAARLLYSNPALRPSARVLALNSRTQRDLWQYGVSGDLPIVIVRIDDPRDVRIARQLLLGHEYLRLKGLEFDLVILNDHPASYAQSLQDELLALTAIGGTQALMDKPGGIFVRRADIMPEADRILLHTVARVVIVTERGSLEEQLAQPVMAERMPGPFVARSSRLSYPQGAMAPRALEFPNGLGGFSAAKREYVTVLNTEQWTPAPWSNVIANSPDFGFLTTETGGGYTWSMNSRENRLTAWSNDAVSDPPGEVIYIRDEESGEIWTPTPLPIREGDPYVVRHGQGYTIFEHTSHGIEQELLLFAPLDAPVKLSRLRLSNLTDRKRRLSVTHYAAWVLGVARSPSAPFITTEFDGTAGSIFARNPYNNEFASRVAFAAMNGRNVTVTCDRKEFIGRNGTLERPAALRRMHLSGRSGAGLDPCAAIQTLLELGPGEMREVVMMLGSAPSRDEASSMVARYRKTDAVAEAFDLVVADWDRTHGTLSVETPDGAMNVMLNGWLLYQTLACRVRARTAFYQSGGAYGFRDQLQDVMALAYSRPDITREHILRAAARQFREGDVQHWWHPPTGRGVRTRFSDDLLWLPYVTSFYVEVTGDTSLLDERVPFIEAPLLAAGIEEAYTQPTATEEMGTLFEHCARTLDRSLAVGEHGLPLMGSGDWNDGMNRVGRGGRGESVWLGWFLHVTLSQFVPLCESRGEHKRAKSYRGHVESLKRAIEENAWDGAWYRRAYFDDGTPLGSAQNEECRIDSIAQSWGIISGAADALRAARAMASVDGQLVRRRDGLILLLAPPFDKSSLEPGYIKGYVPGVRENGGQYTHAAVWNVIAYALAGDGDRAGELFAMLNPINHASTHAGSNTYKVEPYVVAGDVYSTPPHTGRGGWTWYTGAAGWMYRAALESILGFHLRGTRLRIEPCIPRNWNGFTINYRRGTTFYRIEVQNPHGVSRGVAELVFDGKVVAPDGLLLADDGQTHDVRVVLGKEIPLSEREAAEEVRA